MIITIKLPKADANMNEATIGQWFYREGDTVEKDSPLVDIVTDKTTFELDAPETGTLRQIIAPEGSIIPPGYIIALIGTAGEPLPDVEQKNRELLEQQQTTLSQIELFQTEPTETTKPPRPKKVRATPAAKRVAREHGIDLQEVKAIVNVDVINEQVLNDYLEKHNSN